MATFTKRREWRTEVPGLTRDQVQSLMLVRRSMIGRCHNPNNSRFEWYGANGITVCTEWIESTREFLDWAMASGYKPGLEIDRRDSNGNYTPDNCRWVTRQQNCMNRKNRRNSLSRFKGVKRNCGRGKPWQAKIHVNGRCVHIGNFTTEESAARAYDSAALEHFGEFARLNCPQEVAT